ncbi:MAG: hypothetical protein GY898_11035 [Proteobacteria bacterium]|nr:hypothetical protein [Pseudomonadota bacterium]
MVGRLELSPTWRGRLRRAAGWAEVRIFTIGGWLVFVVALRSDQVGHAFEPPPWPWIAACSGDLGVWGLHLALLLACLGSLACVAGYAGRAPEAIPPAPLAWRLLRAVLMMPITFRSALERIPAIGRLVEAVKGPPSNRTKVRLVADGVLAWAVGAFVLEALWWTLLAAEGFSPRSYAIPALVLLLSLPILLGRFVDAFDGLLGKAFAVGLLAAGAVGVGTASAPHVIVPSEPTAA